MVNISNKYIKISSPNNSNKLGFSLIELSIVLIIIGLLVAGITGGASLIKSAKTRRLLNEFRGYQVAIMAFYSANGRYPGDLDNIGLFGEGAYNGTRSILGFIDYFIFTAEEAPFAEMSLDGIIDFKPTETTKNPTSTFGGKYTFSRNNLILIADIDKKVVEQLDKILDNDNIISGKMVASCDGEVQNLPSDTGDSVNSFICRATKPEHHQGYCTSGYLPCVCLIDERIPCVFTSANNYAYYYCKTDSFVDEKSSKDKCTKILFNISL